MNKTHGMGHTQTYTTWSSILTRCLNEKDPNYLKYGAKGITICDSWLKFENFFKDMGIRPKGKEIDRVDNSKGYFPSNCRWATSKENQSNRTNNLIIEYNGTKNTITEWSRILNIPRGTLTKRYHRGGTKLWTLIQKLNKKYLRLSHYMKEYNQLP